MDFPIQNDEYANVVCSDRLEIFKSSGFGDWRDLKYEIKHNTSL